MCSENSVNSKRKKDTVQHLKVVEANIMLNFRKLNTLKSAEEVRSNDLKEESENGF